MAAVALLVALPLTAQEPADTPPLVGSVVDTETGAAIGNAAVSIPAWSLNALSRADGSFEIPGAPTGTLIVRVQRIGYGVQTFVISFRDPGVPLEIRLAPIPVAIEGVDVGVEAEAYSDLSGWWSTAVPDGRCPTCSSGSRARNEG